MYRAAVAEAGAVEPIVKQPQHPYTQAADRLDPAGQHRANAGSTEAIPVRAAARRRGGCSFADRCPVAMTECVEAPPPLYRTEPDRAVACYRHQTDQTVSDLGNVLAVPKSAA